MAIGTVSVNNGTQAVRLSIDLRFPEGVRKVGVRVSGHERIIAVESSRW